MRMAQVVTASALLAVLVACGPTPSTEVHRVAITTASAPSDMCLLALISGRLVAHPQWGLAIQSGTGEFVHPIFPFGYTAATDGTRIALFDESRRIVAYTGDRIEAGGGFGGGADPAWSLCKGSIKVIRP